MFNLEQSITAWRAQMLAAGIKTPVPLEELEGHLREEIEQEVKAGMSGQPAFDAAVLRIGRGAELKAEFTKTKGMWAFLQTEIVSSRLELKFVRSSYFIVCIAFLFFGGMVFFKVGNFSTMTSIERISGQTACVLSCLLCSSGLFGRRIFPIILNKTKRTAICVSLVAPWVIWFMIFLANVNCGMGQFVAEFLWAFVVPVGALTGLISGLEKAAAQKSAPAAL